MMDLTRDEIDVATGEPDPELVQLDAECRCGWSGNTVTYLREAGDRRKAFDQLIRRHQEERPNCRHIPRLG